MRNADSILLYLKVPKHPTRSDTPTARKTKFSFSKCSEKMIFPKKTRTGIWSFLFYQERWYFSSQKISYYSLGRKWKMIFLKKIHGNMTHSSNVLKRWSFQKKKKKLHWNMIFLISWGKMTFLFPKTIFFLQTENER